MREHGMAEEPVLGQGTVGERGQTPTSHVFTDNEREKCAHCGRCAGVYPSEAVTKMVAVAVATAVVASVAVVVAASVMAMPHPIFAS